MLFPRLVHGLLGCELNWFFLTSFRSLFKCHLLSDISDYSLLKLQPPSLLIFSCFFPWNLWSSIMCWNWHAHAHQVNCIHLVPASITWPVVWNFDMRVVLPQKLVNDTNSGFFLFKELVLKVYSTQLRRLYVITYFCWFVSLATKM